MSTPNQIRPFARVALIEIGGSHDECLYSQCLFLQGHAEVTLVVTRDLLDRIALCRHLVDSVTVLSFDSVEAFSWLNIWRLRNYLCSQRFDQVIFNTAQGRIKKLFVLPLPRRTRMLGVIHNTRKFRGSVGQWLISRYVRRYWVLNESLLPSVSSMKTLRFAPCYPIYFPVLALASGIRKPSGETWIGVPGEVTRQRRDYSTLLESLLQWGIGSPIRFILLGRIPHDERKWLNQLFAEYPALTDHVTCFDCFVPVPLFHAYLAVCDAIMPLIHPSVPSFADYLHHKVTGAFNIAFAYRKPLILERSFRHVHDFQDPSTVFYTAEAMDDKFFRQLVDRIHAAGRVAFRAAKWTFAHRQQQYLALIFDLR